ncbi:putative integral membrane protein Pth11-like [Penicillium brasilianum]|uniref:Putative integral membrane protein Pth11-like n=1 Tax=Penicillium brasilianum TaxID=104259 RepID=A0A1S9RYL8_PENBI|nr:putative integral membrane protein Pth11-like [Penicillium brasilianum]
MEIASLATRGLYPKVPPAFESRNDINPTLMMSWWATGFSLAIIIVRLCGRYVRIERFFPEDKVVMLSVIPLTIRMVLVHFVLVFGTNNTQTAGLTQDQIDKRVIGSKLVLAARIFYAIFIWTAKLTVCEFLKRVTGMVWRKSVAIFLCFIHFFLISTLVAVVIATLAECQPMDHYWQVIPDPGPSCRSGYAQLITMGACDVITDLLLVAFPVPIILMAQMPIKRKLALVTLFCLSLILVAITCYRVPSVIERRGAQPYRSLVASFEILAATAVSNLVVIGSFVRDRGAKKLKYKRAQGSASVTESMDNSYVRRNTVMQHQWGSDSDLAGDLGIRLDPKLYSSAPGGAVPIPAPPVPLMVARTGSIDPSWSFNQSQTSDEDRASTSDSLDIKISPREYLPTSQSPRDKAPSSPPPLSRRVSFFDVGGLLNRTEPEPQRDSRPALLSRHTMTSSTTAPVELQRQRRGSRAFLEDLGVLVPRTTASTPPQPQPQSRFSSPPSINTTATTRQLSHTLPPYRTSPDISLDVDVELQDVGGLLSRHTHRP